MKHYPITREQRTCLRWLAMGIQPETIKRPVFFFGRKEIGELIVYPRNLEFEGEWDVTSIFRTLRRNGRVVGNRFKGYTLP